MTYDTCVIEGIQAYEKLIAPELCWPLMKLMVDCCIDGNSKQWICQALKKKKNGKRLPVFGLIVGILDRHYYDDFASDGKEVEEVDVSD